MKKLTYIFLLFFCIQFAFSQDRLFKRDSTKLEVNVVQISPKEIKYKLFSKPEGPTYIVSASEVVLIIFKNGDRQSFNVAPESPATKQFTNNNDKQERKSEEKQNRKKMHFEEVTKTKNAFLFNFTQLIVSNIGIDYIHEFFKGRVQFHLPLSASFGRTDFYSDGFLNVPYGLLTYRRTQKACDVGVGVYINTGKRALTHFIGPLFRWTQFNGKYEAYPSYGSSQYNSFNNELYTFGFVINQAYLMLNNGILYRITPHLNLAASFAVGAVISREFVVNDPRIILSTNDDYTNTKTMAARFSVSFGYRL